MVFPSPQSLSVLSDSSINCFIFFHPFCPSFFLSLLPHFFPSFLSSCLPSFSLFCYVEITHNRLVTLENRTSMMAKAIMPVLKDLKLQINKTYKQLASQYRMMSSAHKRYNLLFRQTHETQMIHHFALLLFKNFTE